jgi:hypothetical protein
MNSGLVTLWPAASRMVAPPGRSLPAAYLGDG